MTKGRQLSNKEIRSVAKGLDIPAKELIGYVREAEAEGYRFEDTDDY